MFYVFCDPRDKFYKAFESCTKSRIVSHEILVTLFNSLFEKPLINKSDWDRTDSLTRSLNLELYLEELLINTLSLFSRA